jgi:type II secretory pathway predicted ATPase ExeA
MYFKHYNLTRKPFGLTPGPDFFWFSEKHKEALATLRYGILGDLGFLLLTGEVGVGKTALIHRLLSSLDSSTIVAHITDPGLTINDFFKLLAAEFGIDKPFNSKGEFLIILEQFLLQAYQDEKKVLLIVDEAQRVNSVLLDQIRVLSNIELNDHKLINIFFIGQPEFKNTLRTHKNRPIRQRIAVYYHVQPLDELETGQYIEHRLEIAGAQREIFLPDAIYEIHRITKGYPRAINIICDHALLTGYSVGMQTIDSTIIRECENELSIEEESEFDFTESMKASSQSSMIPSSLPASPPSSSPKSPSTSSSSSSSMSTPNPTPPPNFYALRFKYNPAPEPNKPVPEPLSPPPPQKSKIWYYPMVVAVSIAMVAVAGYYFLGFGPDKSSTKQKSTGPVNFQIWNTPADENTSRPPTQKSHTASAQNDSTDRNDSKWSQRQKKVEQEAEAAERPPKETKPKPPAPETSTITVETAPVEEEPTSDDTNANTLITQTDSQDKIQEEPSVSDTNAVPSTTVDEPTAVAPAPPATQNETVVSTNESAGQSDRQPPSTPPVEDTTDTSPLPDPATTPVAESPTVDNQAAESGSPPSTPTPNENVGDLASASAKPAIPATAALQPQDTQSSPAAVEKPKPEIDDDLENSLRSFVQSYCNTYSAKDLNSFVGYFSPDALENGKRFKDLLPKYRKIFTFIDTIYYRIDVQEMKREEDGETLRINGRFFFRWLLPDKKWRENSGRISMRVKESGSSFMVQHLDYQRTN